ncbi:MAG: DUF6220 domain-containing protein [Anaerolineales bacterium]
MRRVVRYIYVAVAWLAVAGFLGTIYLAGMAVFANRSYWETHKQFGYTLGWIIPSFVVLGLLSWIPRRLAAWLAAMLFFFVLHTSLPLFQEDLPWISAFHPVSAVLLVWLGMTHARRAGKLLLDRPAASVEPVPTESASQA